MVDKTKRNYTPPPPPPFFHWDLWLVSWLIFFFFRFSFDDERRFSRNEPGHDKRRQTDPAGEEDESHVVERLVDLPEVGEEAERSQAVAHENEDVHLAYYPPQGHQFRIAVHFAQQFVLRNQSFNLQNKIAIQFK